MTHKVHPKIFRIRGMSDWHSRGYYGKNFPQYLEEDFKIRKILRKKLKDSSIQNIEIERFPNKVNIIINSARPGLIIGRGGAGVEIIKKFLEREIFQTKPFVKAQKETRKEIKIDIREVKDVWAEPNLVVEWMASRLEKRIAFRRVMKQALAKIMLSKNIEGARIEISGRLGGTEIARREFLQKGKLPRQTIRADIDYGFGEAYCSYGVIGIKVWIYKGEKF